MRWILILLLMVSCQKKVVSQTFKMGSLQLPRSETLVTALDSALPGMDWYRTGDTRSSWVQSQIMQGLVEYDFSGEKFAIVPGLAKTWKSDPLNKTWTFSLRRGVVWSDGVPLTAQHFYDGLQRALTPETAAPDTGHLFVIQGAHSFNQGKIPFEKVGVKVRDPWTLEITLRKGMPFFPSMLSHSISYPIRIDIVDKFGDQWTEPENIVTLGPYRLHRWKKDQHIILKRNETYWGEPAPIEYVVFRILDNFSTQVSLFKKKELDLVREVPSDLMTYFRSRGELRSFPSLLTYYLGFSVRETPFQDARVRRALSLVIDRRELVKAVQGLYTELWDWAPPSLFQVRQRSPWKRQTEKAKQLLKDAGYDKDNPLPTIVMGYNTNPTHKIIVENIQAQLSQTLGLRIEVRNNDWKSYLGILRSEKSFPMFRLGWGGTFPDPFNFFTLMTGAEPNNFTGWKNQKYDQLVEQAMSETQAEKKQDLYENALKLLVEDEVPVIPLLSNTNHVLLQKRVLGFREDFLSKYQLYKLSLAKEP